MKCHSLFVWIDYLPNLRRIIILEYLLLLRIIYTYLYIKRNLFIILSRRILIIFVFYYDIKKVHHELIEIKINLLILFPYSNTVKCTLNIKLENIIKSCQLT